MKTVLVTGATSGLGRAAAIALAQAGHRVIATGPSYHKVSVLRHEHPEISRVLRLDVKDMKDFRSIPPALYGAGFTEVDTLFVNAAVHMEHPHDYDGLPYDQWPHLTIQRETYEVNLFGALYTVNAFLSFVQASQDGRILFTNGTLGSFGWHHHPDERLRASLTIDHPSYAGSKAALNMEMVHLARRHPNLFVASLNPGWIATKIGGTGIGGMKPKPVERALPHILKYLVGDIDRSRSGQFIEPGDKIVPW